MVPYHSEGKETKKKFGTREWVIAVADLTVLLFGGRWQTLGLWTRTPVECCKETLMGNPNRSLEIN